MSKDIENQIEVKANEQILYLFTSTHENYINDALDLLALPSGLNYRFRYDVRHLPSDLFHDTNKTQLKDLNGKNAYLIHAHVNFENLSQSKYPAILELVPIRKAKVIEAKLVGDFVWLHFSLAEWVEYSVPKSSNLNPYHETIKDILPDNSKDFLVVTAVLQTNKNITCICPTLHEDQDLVISNWSNLISYVQSFDEHKNSIFLKFLKIQSSGETDVKLPTNLGDNTFGFELDSGKTFQIHILERYYKKNSEVPFLLEVKTNENQIIHIKSSDQVQGKYDILRFTITSDLLMRSQQSFLNILPSSKLSTTLISKPFYNIKIKPNTTQLIRSALIIISGISIAAVSTDFKEILGNYSTLLSIFGAVLTAIGAFWLPKK